MDAAAKHIQLLRQSIPLPTLPYQLAKGTDRRFRVPPENIGLFEEREFRQLQYMTLLSNDDRGLVYTRAYYDMREEPPNPSAAKEGGPQAEKKPKTKLSLSDYKNKKKAYDSPPDSAASTAKPNALRKEIADAKAERDTLRRDVGARPRESEPHRDGRGSQAHDAPNDRSSNRPDPRPRHELHDNSDKRKRVPEDDNLRLPKKPKPSIGTPLDDRARTPRDDTPRRREREPAPAQDRATHSQSKDGRTGAASSLLNGRSVLKGALGSQSQAHTPAQRARGDSLNGSRTTPTTNHRVASSKQDGPSKVSVPPLLSPLHFSMGDDALPPKERRRRDDPDEPSKFPKPSKPSAPAPAKKDRSRLPPLLSPTLPPLLEEELVRIQHESGNAPNTTKPAPSSESIKKPRPAKRDDEDDERPKQKIRERDRDEPPSGRYMVTLRCGRHNAKTLKRLLALPPRKERSVSMEAQGAGVARKRPAGTTELVGDSIAVKRPRMSDVPPSNKLGPPSTPAKVSTSMARVASNNSQAPTPGDMNSLTPGDRPPTRQEPADHARIKSLRDRHVRFRDLGYTLKHRRDALLSGKNGADRAPRAADVKLGIALCLESAMAYMASFRAIFESRRLENKAQDPKTWDSILPMLDTIRHEVGEGRHLAMDALYQQLRGVILEELIKCYWSIDPVTHARSLIHYERMRASVWKSAADAADRVTEPRMRAGFGPWTSAEDAVHVGLRILRRWTADEDVAWSAEVNLQANGA